MDLHVKMNNCYGIGSLDVTFSFDGNPIIIHAPNGTFKTSFCKTMNNYSRGLPSKDLVTGVPGILSITRDGVPLDPTEPVIFNGTVDDYNSITEKSKLLLFNKTLRNKLDSLEEPYHKLKSNLYQSLKKDSGFKTIDDMLDAIFNSFGVNDEEELFKTIQKNIRRIKQIPFKITKYSDYFSNDIKKMD